MNIKKNYTLRAISAYMQWWYIEEYTGEYNDSDIIIYENSMDNISPT